MTYRLDIADQAKEDLARLKRNEASAFTKAKKMIAELREHPRTGIGKPKPLTSDRAGQWSRRITRKHRMVYEIHDESVSVCLLSSYGHYDDK